jgi:protein-disulfide isomerase
LSLKTLALAAVIALPLGASLAACSESPSDLQFNAKVRNYLLEHPEVLREAMAKLEEKDRAAQAKAATEAIRRHRTRIERDARDFVANPTGRITVTEFYDYNCGYCKTISPEVIQLIRENPDVRFVFKEFHIFDQPSSLRGARGALLARRSGRYVEVHSEMMAQKPLQPAQVDAILRRNGVDPGPLDNPAALAEIDRQLLDIQKLAADLRIDGTPGFVIGDVLVPGADMDAVRAAIAQARARR